LILGRMLLKACYGVDSEPASGWTNRNMADTHPTKRFRFVAMLLVAAAMAGCHHARVAYRARVLDQATPAMPVAPLPLATPQAVVPNVQPALPATPQPV